MAQTLSTRLNVSLYDNPLTPEPDDYTGRVQLNGVFSNETIASRIVRERTEYRLETIVNILNLADDMKRTALASGYAVNDGVAQMYPSVSGRFVGAQAQFDSKQHSVGVTLTPSAALRAAIANTTVVVQGVATTGPVINKVTDVYTSQDNTSITPGRNLKIAGQRLKIVGNDPAVIGVWFMNVLDTTQRIHLDSRDLVDNNPSLLTVVAPALAPGEYYVEVVTQFSTSNVLTKEPRSYRFEVALNVPV
jgi:DNA-binding domain/Domain of unknown function (DUF4469) with IG-like fold